MVNNKLFFCDACSALPKKKSVSRENFDVYIKPIVEELQQLWKAIPVYDVLKLVGFRSFTLRGVLLWIMHDFANMAKLLGWHIKGTQHVQFAAQNLGVNI
jgi:hypothetical protein